MTRQTAARFLALFARLLKPLTDAIQQEFGVTLIAYPPKPAPVPVVPPAPLPVAVPQPESVAVEVAPVVTAAGVADAPKPAKRSYRAKVVAERNETPSPLTAGKAGEADAVYVRKGIGKATRYVVAEPGEEGERFTRRVVGGRKKYEPVK